MKTKEEIEQLAEKYLNDNYNGIDKETVLGGDVIDVYTNGYTQCQEDNTPYFTEETWNTMCSIISELRSELKDKKHTEEDLRQAIDETIKACNTSQKESYGDLEIDTDEIINSLNKKD